jgi:homopolymeric O-antigen transport system permease protein
VIPLASIGSGIVDFGIACIVLLLLMLFYDVDWSFNLLLAPPLIVGVIFVALGVGTFLCALNVAYRDFRYVIPYMVQMWLFVTPVVYPASLVPEAWRWALYLNPMAGFVEAFRAAFLNQPFDFGGILLSLGVAIVVFIAGVAYFEKAERQFADII